MRSRSAEGRPQRPSRRNPRQRLVQRKGSGPGLEEQKRQPVQKAEAKPEEKKPVQAERRGKPVPRRPWEQRRAAPLPRRAPASRSSPRPGSQLEPRLGADSGHARRPRRRCGEIGGERPGLRARSPTWERASGLGPGAPQSDTRLMAHEATHVVQQAGGACSGWCSGPMAALRNRPRRPRGPLRRDPPRRHPAAATTRLCHPKLGEVIDAVGVPKMLRCLCLKIPQFKFPLFAFAELLDNSPRVTGRQTSVRNGLMTCPKKLSAKSFRRIAEAARESRSREGRRWRVRALASGGGEKAPAK